MDQPSQRLRAEVRAAIDAVHRRPQSLRKWEITSSEGIMRGARLAALLCSIPEEQAIDTYSLLAPDLIFTTSGSFLRSPLQVLAKMDVLAGGPGRPVAAVAELQRFAKVIANRPEQLEWWVHALIATRGYFGPRSGLIALAAMRLAAVATGFDPRGLCVPETYLHRHAKDYRAALAAFDADPAALAEIHLRAYLAGAAEAEGIAKLA